MATDNGHSVPFRGKWQSAISSYNSLAAYCIRITYSLIVQLPPAAVRRTSQDEQTSHASRIKIDPLLLLLLLIHVNTSIHQHGRDCVLKLAISEISLELQQVASEVCWTEPL